MDDRRIETHPDLIDPEWQKQAERAARLETNKVRRRSKRSRPSKWHPGRWAVLALVVLIAGAVVLKQVKSGGHESDIVGSQPAATSSSGPAAPAIGPSTLPPIAQVDLKQPSLTTPAASWQQGIAGFSVPPASKTGAFSASQVSAAFSKVLQAVTAAHLDHKALDAHDGTALLALLAPNEGKYVKTFLDKPDKAEASGYLTMLADGFHLLPAGPRLKGRLNALPGATSGELVIRAEYVVAYAFAPEHPGMITGPGDIVTFQRMDQTYTVRTGARYGKADQGLAFSTGQEEYFSMACKASKAGFLAPRFSEKDLDVRPIQDETAVYDLDKPIDMTQSCG
jgi:hypothetical protein